MEDQSANPDDVVMLVMASPQLIGRRKEVCRSCTHMTRPLNVMTCSLCGCVISLKTRFVGTRCPAGQW